MSRASRWAERGSETVRVDRPRFESDTVEAWVTDRGELVIWHKPVLGAKDAPMTPPETALALAEWITSVFSADLVDVLDAHPEPLDATDLPEASEPVKFHIDPRKWLPRGWSDPLCNRCGVKCPSCATPVDEPPALELGGKPIQTEPQWRQRAPAVQSRLVEVGGQMRWVA